MVAALNHWGPAALIAIGYVATAIRQARDFDSLKATMKAEFERLHNLDRRLAG